VPTYIGKFKKGMKIGAEVHKDYELREMTTEDMLEAELEFSTATPMNYSAALAARQLLRVGSYEGPFTTKMIKKLLDPVDFNILTKEGLNGVAALGEDSSPSTQTG
jgi:phage FluMu protein gp41